jgi:hypothetical protein
VPWLKPVGAVRDAAYLPSAPHCETVPVAEERERPLGVGAGSGLRFAQ